MDNPPIHSRDNQAMMEALRANLQNIMAQRSVSTIELARKSGVGQDLLYKFMRGESRSISTGDAARIAAHFSMSLDALLQVQAPESIAILELLKRLDPVTQEMVLTQIEALAAKK